MLESDRAARSRRILRETLAAVALVAFVLIGGVATYWFVNIAGTSNAEVAPPSASDEASRGATPSPQSGLG